MHYIRKNHSNRVILQLSGIAGHKKASIHFAKPNPKTPNLEWGKLENTLQKWIIKKGINLIVYSKPQNQYGDMSDNNSSNQKQKRKIDSVEKTDPRDAVEVGAPVKKQKSK